MNNVEKPLLGRNRCFEYVLKATIKVDDHCSLICILWLVDWATIMNSIQTPWGWIFVCASISAPTTAAHLHQFPSKVRKLKNVFSVYILQSRWSTNMHNSIYFSWVRCVSPWTRIHWETSKIIRVILLAQVTGNISDHLFEDTSKVL